MMRRNVKAALERREQAARGRLMRRGLRSLFKRMVKAVVHVVTSTVHTAVSAIVDPIEDAFHKVGGLWHMAKEELTEVTTKWAGALDFIRNPRALVNDLWEGAKVIWKVVDLEHEILQKVITKYIVPSTEWVLNFLDFLGPAGWYMHGFISELRDQGLGLLLLATPTGIFHFVADLGKAVMPLFSMENIKATFNEFMTALKTDPVQTLMTTYTAASNPAGLAIKFIIDDILNQPTDELKWKTAGKWTVDIAMLAVPFLGEEAAAVETANGVRAASSAAGFAEEASVFKTIEPVTAAPSEAQVLEANSRLATISGDLDVFPQMADAKFWTTDANGMRILNPATQAEFESTFTAEQRARFTTVFRESHGWRFAEDYPATIGDEARAIDAGADAAEASGETPGFCTLARRSTGGFLPASEQLMNRFNNMYVRNLHRRIDCSTLPKRVQAEIKTFQDEFNRVGVDPKMVEMVPETFAENLKAQPAGVEAIFPKNGDDANRIVRMTNLAKFMRESSQVENKVEGAAKLGSNIRAHQVFIDGNHRTSTFMMYKWMEKNAIVLDEDPMALIQTLQKADLDPEIGALSSADIEHAARSAAKTQEHLMERFTALEQQGKLIRRADGVLTAEDQAKLAARYEQLARSSDDFAQVREMENSFQVPKNKNAQGQLEVQFKPRNQNTGADPQRTYLQKSPEIKARFKSLQDANLAYDFTSAGVTAQNLSGQITIQCADTVCPQLLNWATDKPRISVRYTPGPPNVFVSTIQYVLRSPNAGRALFEAASINWLNDFPTREQISFLLDPPAQNVPQPTTPAGTLIQIIFNVMEVDVSTRNVVHVGSIRGPLFSVHNPDLPVEPVLPPAAANRSTTTGPPNNSLTSPGGAAPGNGAGTPGAPGAPPPPPSPNTGSQSGPLPPSSPGGARFPNPTPSSSNPLQPPSTSPRTPSSSNPAGPGGPSPSPTVRTLVIGPSESNRATSSLQLGSSAYTWIGSLILSVLTTAFFTSLPLN
ncbi:hypothetical protein HK102_002814 [Quaeritorhiza haematococci]|nr:hypothetical protein HK102_002814 [Quaeritorhiza haematococci]